MRSGRREQQVRLRLVRQRPGRVRERVGIDTQAQKKPRQWQDLTVMISLVTVILSAIGTLWAVRVSQDQLQQSRAADEQTARAQASRVATWAEEDPKGNWSVHFMNRTLDPIANVFQVFVTQSLGETHVRWDMGVASVPPCTDMVIRQEQLGYMPSGSVWDETNPQRPPAGMRSLKGLWLWFRPIAAQFDDRDGQTWFRVAGRLTRGRRGELPVPALPAYSTGIVLGRPAFRSVGACGDSSL